MPWQAAAPDKGVVRHQTAQETIPSQARRAIGRISATTQVPASAAGRLASFGTSGWTAPRWPGSPARMREPQRDLVQLLLQARHVQSKAIPGCCQAVSTPGYMPHR